MIDHLKLYEGSTDYLYGSTRTYMTEASTGTFTQCYIFRVRLKSDHKIDDAGGLKFTKLSNASIGSDAYVTGISNTMENSENEFHLTLFDPTNRKLYYLKPHLS